MDRYMEETQSMSWRIEHAKEVRPLTKEIFLMYKTQDLQNQVWDYIETNEEFDGYISELYSELEELKEENERLMRMIQSSK